MHVFSRTSTGLCTGEPLKVCVQWDFYWWYFYLCVPTCVCIMCVDTIQMPRGEAKMVTVNNKIP